ncbi:MAG: cytochrome c3 family protein [Coriobacteriia bacterium]
MSTVTATAPPPEETPPRRRSRKGLWITLGVIGVIIVALLIGYFATHKNPRFCNAVCHSPMDPYVNGYYSGDDNILVTAHADNNIICLDCHPPTLSQQVTEAVNWISGNFTDPLPRQRFATREFCLQSGCHDNDDIVEATVDWGGDEGVNPHDSHQGQLDCYNCHSVHHTSVMYCNQCHNWEVPEGWEESSGS